MAQPQKVHAPRIDPPHLGELGVGDPDVLVPGAEVDGLAFPDVRRDALGLRGALLESTELAGLVVEELDLSSARVVDTRFRQVGVSVLKASRGVLRDVEVDGGRLGAVEAYDATWTSVHVRGCKVSYVNLRGSTLSDVQFTDCVIDELDLGQADVTRMRLPGTRVGTLVLRDARLTDLDLRDAELDQVTGLSGGRGLVVSSFQLMTLAPALAAELGLRVVD